MDSMIHKSRPYAVVYFPEDNSTSVVPVGWLTLKDKKTNDYLCKWPSSNSSSKSKKNANPDTSWRSYKANVRRFSKTYKSGIEYMKKYQYDSDPTVTSCDDSAKQNNIFTHSHSSSPSSPPTVPTVEESNRTPTMEQFNQMQAKLDLVLKYMVDFKSDLTDIRAKTSTLKSIDNYALDRLENFKTLTSLEEVQEFDGKLNSEEEFLKAVKMCGCLGGKDVPEAVRRILQKVFSHNVALSLCWNQGSAKTSVQKFQNILQFITVSLRSNPLYKEISLDSIEAVIKRWFRYASDRNGGRLARMRKNKSADAPQNADPNT